jgi:rubrerythrin
MDKPENDMLCLYKACADKAEDEKIKTVCGQLCQAEAKHRVLVKKAAGLLQK